MRALLEIRERLRAFYSGYSFFIRKALQFLLALIVFWAIGQTLGYFQLLMTPVIMVGLALICMFLPLNFTVFVSALLVLGHLYKLSLEVMGVVAAIMLVLFIFFLRFAPKQAVVVLLLPLLYGIGIPYVMPVALGLISTPASLVACACGTVVYYMLHYVSTYAATLSTASDASVINRVAELIKGILLNQEMFLAIIAFSLVILIIYVIRHLPMDHSWTVAICFGIFANFLVFVIGHMMFDIPVDYAHVLTGSIFSLIVALILKWFYFMVDYSRTRRVQFEDDDYYYYVKAVPKVTVATRDKRVKKMRHWKDQRREEEYEEEEDEEYEDEE